MPKPSREKHDEYLQQHSLTVTRSRRTPKPNPKYSNDILTATSASTPDPSGGDDDDNGTKNEENLTKSMKLLPKKRLYVPKPATPTSTGTPKVGGATTSTTTTTTSASSKTTASKISDFINKSKSIAASRPDHNDDQNDDDTDDDDFFNHVDDDDDEIDYDDDDDEGKPTKKSNDGKKKKWNWNDKDKDNDFVLTSDDEYEIEGAGRGRKRGGAGRKTRQSKSPLKGNSPKTIGKTPVVTRQDGRSKDDGDDDNGEDDDGDVEKDVPSFTIINVDDIISSKSTNDKEVRSRKSKLADEEKNDGPAEKKRVTRQSMINSSNTSTPNHLSSADSSLNDSNGKNRRKTQHTNILKEFDVVKRGPGRPPRVDSATKPSATPPIATTTRLTTTRTLTPMNRFTRLGATATSKTTTTTSKASTPLTVTATAAATTTTTTSMSNTKNVATPMRILNSTLSRTNASNKTQPMITKIVTKPSSTKVDQASQQQSNLTSIANKWKGTSSSTPKGRNDDDDEDWNMDDDMDDDDDEDEDDFNIKSSGGGDGGSKKMPPLFTFNKSKENLKTYKNTLRKTSNGMIASAAGGSQDKTPMNKTSTRVLQQLSQYQKKTTTIGTDGAGGGKTNNVSSNNSNNMKKVTCFETWHVINIPNLMPPVQKSWVLMNLIKLGNDIRTIQLPNEDWNYRITLSKIVTYKNKSNLNNNTNHNHNNNNNNNNVFKNDVYTGEIHDQNIEEANKHEYEPVNIIFRRQTSKTKKNGGDYDRAIIFKNRSYFVTINGKNVLLVGSPQYINTLVEIEILLNIVNDIKITDSYIETANNL